MHYEYHEPVFISPSLFARECHRLGRAGWELFSATLEQIVLDGATPASRLAYANGQDVKATPSVAKGFICVFRRDIGANTPTNSAATWTVHHDVPDPDIDAA